MEVQPEHEERGDRSAHDCHGESGEGTSPETDRAAIPYPASTARRRPIPMARVAGAPSPSGDSAHEWPRSNGHCGPPAVARGRGATKDAWIIA